MSSVVVDTDVVSLIFKLPRNISTSLTLANS